MRAIAVISATMLFLAAGTAWACPMQSASTGQNQSVASSKRRLEHADPGQVPGRRQRLRRLRRRLRAAPRASG